MFLLKFVAVLALIAVTAFGGTITNYDGGNTNSCTSVGAGVKSCISTNWWNDTNSSDDRQSGAFVGDGDTTVWNKKTDNQLSNVGNRRSESVFSDDWGVSLSYSDQIIGQDFHSLYSTLSTNGIGVRDEFGSITSDRWVVRDVFTWSCILAMCTAVDRQIQIHLYDHDDFSDWVMTYFGENFDRGGPWSNSEHWKTIMYFETVSIWNRWPIVELDSGSATPEPASIGMVLVGLGFGLRIRRFRRR